MKKKKERRKGRVLAWVLSLAMVCSMVSIPGKAEAESVNVSLSVDTASKTVTAGTGNIVEVSFDVPADYDTMAKLSAAGITKLEVTLKVTGYTQAASGTAGVQAFIGYGEQWETCGSWQNLSQGQEITTTADFSAYLSEGGNVYAYGVQLANVTGSVTYQIVSARLIGTTSGSGSGGDESWDIENDNISVSYTAQDQYSAYTEYYFTVKNQGSSAVTGNLVVTFDKTREKNWWITESVSKDYSISLNGNVLTVSNLTIPANSSSEAIQMQLKPTGANITSVTFNGQGISASGNTLNPSNGGSGSGSTGGTVSDSTTDLNLDIEYNYAKLLQESLYFYDANMCGPNVGETSAFSWRDDCHTADATATYNGMTVDVSGGFHDAGDHVKFGLPQGYSAAVLALSYYEFKDAFDELGQTAHLQTIMDYFCDYFVNCSIYTNNTAKTGSIQAFCYQVGDGTDGSASSDHGYWGAPESQPDCNRSNTILFTTDSMTATDVVSISACALALHAYNFPNSSKSAQYLQTARDLFTYATNHNKTIYQVTQYVSDTWEDDYCSAAAALYLATGESQYLTALNTYYGNVNTGWVLCWNKTWGIASALKEDWDATYSIAAYGTTNTAQGFKFIDGWGSARYNTAEQFLGLVYDKNKNTDSFGTWATGQMKYLLGNNQDKRCFVVGYNENSSKYPHHRAASNSSDAAAVSANHYTLLGALVGGPSNASDYYRDAQDDYQCNEVALDYNATLVGAAAGLYLLHKDDTDAVNTLASEEELSAINVTKYYGTDSQVTPAGSAALTASVDSVSCIDQTYGDTTAASSSVTLTNTGDGDATGVKAALTTGTAFTVSLSSSSIGAGQTATLTVTPKTGLSAGAYSDTVTVSYGTKKLTVSVSFTVAAKTVTSVDFPTASAITTTDTLSKSVLTGGDTQYGTFAWVNGNQKLSAGSQSANVVLTLNAAAKQNYNFSNLTGFTYNSAAGTLTKAVTVTVTKAAAPAITFPTASAIQYGQKLSASTLTGGSTQYGSFAWENDNEQMLTVGTVSKNVVFTPADTETYDWSSVNKTGAVSVQVTKADRTDVPAAVQLSSRTATGITVISQNGCQYSKDGGQTWQDSNIFTGLAPFTAYQVTVRYAENDNYNAGGAAAAVTIYTLVEDPYTIDVSKLSDENYVAALCRVDGSSAQPTVTYDDSTKTLTLTDGRVVNEAGYVLTGSNPNLTVKTSADTDITLKNAAIKKLEIDNTSGTGTTITLSGVNTVTQGITGTGKLIITGQGQSSLTVDADTAGIQAAELIIQSGVLNITAGDIALSADKITISGGTVTATVTRDAADNSVIQAAESIVLTGGSIVTNKPEGSSMNDFSVSDGGSIIVDGAVIAGSPVYSVTPTDQQGNALNMVTVTVKDDTGAVLSTMQVNSGADIVLSELNVKAADGITNYADSNSGYALSWSCSGVSYALTDIIANVSEDITLSAVWTRIILNLSGASLVVNGSYVYNGAAQTPAVTVVLDGKTLVSGTDYDVTYSNNINAGTATVKVTGKDGYQGTVSTSFTIAAKSVTGLAYKAIAAMQYTGAALKPAVTVTDGTKTLTQGVDYQVTYSNNVNPGTGKVTVTGKGNYTGSRTLTFTIQNPPTKTLKSVANLTVDAIAVQGYTGNAITPALTIRDGSKLLTAGVDYTVAYQNNINVGKATAVITGKGDYTGTKAVNFSITIQKNAVYTVGNFQYKVTKTAAVGTGAVSLVKVAKKKAKATIPASIKICGISFQVTEIGTGAFKGDVKLTTLKIGKNVTKIGANAFNGCTKLKTAAIGSGVTTIGKKAFYNCKSMTKLTISSKKLKKSSIGAKAFTKMGSKNYKKLTVKVPKSKLKTYKKILKKKGLSKKAAVKK